MTMNRRQFLTVAACALAGCAVAGAGAAGELFAAGEKTVDAGPIEEFKEEGVYTRFRYQGFFLVRRGGRLFALSSTCTHRKCSLKPAEEGAFICPCHGSRFDAEGKVTKGPAEIDLPEFPLRTTPQGRVLVQLTESI